jgi:hypothetical protein
MSDISCLHCLKPLPELVLGSFCSEACSADYILTAPLDCVVAYFDGQAAQNDSYCVWCGGPCYGHEETHESFRSTISEGAEAEFNAMFDQYASPCDVPDFDII